MSTNVISEELTNEAAEMIGRYVKGGKNKVLSLLLEKGGITHKEIEPGTVSGRKEGYERVFYYFPDGSTACYSPARAARAEAAKNKRA